MDAFLRRVVLRRETEMAWASANTPPQETGALCVLCRARVHGENPTPVCADCRQKPKWKWARRERLKKLVTSERERLERIRLEVEEGQPMADKFCTAGHKLRKDNESGKCAKCKRGDPVTGRTDVEVVDRRREALKQVAAERRGDAAAIAKRELAERLDATAGRIGAVFGAINERFDARKPEHSKKLERFRILADALGLDPDEILSGWVENWMRPLRDAVTPAPAVLVSAGPSFTARLSYGDAPAPESMNGAGDGFGGSDFGEGGGSR